VLLELITIAYEQIIPTEAWRLYVVTGHDGSRGNFADTKV
jgi:hypothetical protein